MKSACHHIYPVYSEYSLDNSSPYYQCGRNKSFLQIRGNSYVGDPIQLKILQLLNVLSILKW